MHMSMKNIIEFSIKLEFIKKKKEKKRKKYTRMPEKEIKVTDS